eukprot:TRINITY_DN721_c0_g1_i1.p1 TRINITY_DN721_c0_g1~~TRINITY_DN721_c0_g1_i1.p1  ORF type:complete len:157 (+),score=46.58 TRINITY_DN721_c0_g1_i1:78-548(+)
MGGYISSFLCNIVGCTFPVYASFKAIESPATNDDTQWLTYWVVFSVFTLLESFFDRIAFWLPFYYEFKLILLIALQLPQFKLAATLYESYIAPFFRNHQTGIDGFVAAKSAALADKAKSVTNDIITKHGPEMINAIVNASLKAQQNNSQENQKKAE